MGVLYRKKPTDYLGGNMDIDIDEDWEVYLIGPKYKLEHEIQVTKHFDSWACTIFAGNDVKELIMMRFLHRRLIPPKDVRWLTDNGYFTNGYINFDDRVPAMHANITQGVGTYIDIANSALRNWNVPEGILKDNPKTFSEYYDKNRLTDEAKNINDEFNKRFGWHWFWIENLNDLRKTPFISCVRFANGEECLQPEGRFNHAVCEYGIDGNCRKIDDSYQIQLKKYHPNFIGWRTGFRLTILNQISMKIENNKLYLLVEGPEQKLAMGLDNKLWVYEQKIDTLLNSASRSGQFQPPKPITMAEWNSCEKVNGKGVKI